MIVSHAFTAHGKCPANGQTDHYDIEVVCDRFVKCEDIVAVAERWLIEPVFQEHFTQGLATELACTVRTSCRHLSGGRVLTKCECKGATHGS